ncbi:MAG: hypothetical protein AMS15_06590 [Planctomycetes bacterium DG_23]|nr:MAG: hypothetical protein AMS15_06590 [Planctomycetes bacterium DG_23]
MLFEFVKSFARLILSFRPFCEKKTGNSVICSFDYVLDKVANRTKLLKDGTTSVPPELLRRKPSQISFCT